MRNKAVAGFFMAAGVACLMFRVLVAESYFAGDNRVGRFVLAIGILLFAAGVIMYLSATVRQWPH